MQKATKIAALVEDIHDAGIEPARWNEVVVGIRNFLGAQACGLVSKNAISKLGVTHYHCGVDSHYIQLYADTYSQFDPLVNLPRLGGVASIPDLVAYDDYRKGRFYQEWLKPPRCINLATAVIEKPNASRSTVMGVPPGKRMFDAEMRMRMEQVV